ncbi:MAG: Hsp20/alpha crystallin family protein [Streptosporangiaceae bacterium]
MYLTTFDPFARDLGRQFDRLARRNAFAPAAMPLDVVRHDGDVTLRFDVPGSDPDSIEVTVDRGVLTVSVKRQEERTENDKFFVRERSMGTFTRRLRLSENLNADAVEATYTNGVLEVRIPVLEQAKPRKVEVRTGQPAEQVASTEQAEEIAA